MSRRIRIAEDTQLAISVPFKILRARLVSAAATTADFYDEADNSATATAKKIALATTTTVLHDEDGGVMFNTGCYIDWTAGEIFIDVE